VEIPRSSFDRSFAHKTTFDAGHLIPILVDEALPGDTYNVNMTGFARLATPIFPIMDNMFMETFFFAVPMRLLWDNWQKFNGEQTNPEDSTDFLLPQLSSGAGGFNGESIHDHMGLPPHIPNYDASCMPHRAYNLIWNEWFRDQNLQDSVVNHTGDGPDAKGEYDLLRRGKRHDYFTSCLPFPQKGEPVGIDLGVIAPVIPTGDDTPLFEGVDTPNEIRALASGLNADEVHWSGTQSTFNQNYKWSETKLVADLGSSTIVQINQLREAFQIQRLLERDARGGTRYTEIIRSHFGVVSPDARLQRPEYLGGGSTPVIISPVAQTSATDAQGPDQSPQANLAAIGTANLRNHGFTKSFTEHCLIIGLINVRADLTYQQGLDRMWSRQTRFDFFWPAFSHLGEQAVLNKEIFIQGDVGGLDDDAVFGYQERYAEYRYKPSLITGLMRSVDPQTLDAWHLSQDFETLPVLGDVFIQDTPPVDRVIAVPSEPHFIFDSYFSMRCARPMPLYGVPGFIDHF